MMICAGNLCRSPFASAYMDQCLQKANMETGIYSRGLLALPGQRPPKEALATAAKFNIDLSEHIAQPMLAPDIERAGLILVMSPGQRSHITKGRPACIGKVFLLSQASPKPLARKPVQDPVGKDMATYREVYSEITQHIDAWIKRFGISFT